MGIHIDPHTLKRAIERGTSEAEIKDVLKTGQESPAKHGRFRKTKAISFGRERNGTYDEQKRVEVIDVLESNALTTVTVYVLFGEWGE